MPSPPSAPRLEARRYKIEELLSLLRAGAIRIPRFQRALRWTDLDTTRLFDSVYRNYPIGTLLFWERDAEAGSVVLGPVELAVGARTDALWVVDGQQRITSLAAALLPGADPGHGPFDLVFDLVTQEFTRARGPGSDTKIPVRAAYDLQQVLGWVRSRELPQNLQDVAFRLADRLRNYEVPAYVVQTQDEQVLKEIFDRTNTFGKTMRKGEVFRALNTDESDSAAGIGALERDVDALGFGRPAGNTLAYCVLSTRGSDVLRDFRKEFSSSRDQAEAMKATSAALARVRDFLAEDAGVPHFQLVPYQHQLVGLVRFFALHPEPDPYVRVLLRRWFWQAAEVGAIPKSGNTGTLKSTVRAVGEDPIGSVHALLALSSTVYTGLEVGSALRWTEAGTRAAVCALAALRPVDLTTGKQVDVTGTIDQLGREALTTVVDPKVEEGRSLANRVFAPVDSDEPREVLRARLLEAPPAWAATLGITSDMVKLLIRDEDGGFLDRRLTYLHSLTMDFVAARTERDRPVRHPVSELL